MEEKVPELSSIKPRSKPILADSDVITFEECLISNPIHEKSSYKLKNVCERVYYIDNVLSKEECSSLRREIDRSSYLSFWCYGKEHDEDVKSFRNAATIEIHSDGFCNKIWQRIKHLFAGFDVFISSDPDHLDYERDLIGNWKPIGLNPDSLFARYPSGGSFAPHTDGRAVLDFNTRSHYSIVLFLNSVEKENGAGTRIYDASAVQRLSKVQNRWTSDPSLILEEIEAVEGRLLLFHQSLVHEGVPPGPGYLKYIIRSDLIYERSPKVCDSPNDRLAYQLFRQAEEIAENGHVEESLKLFKKALKLSPTLAELMGQS